MQAMKSLINQSQLSLQDLQNGHHHQIATSQMPPQFDPSSSSHHDEDFLDQMLSSLPSSTWPDVNAAAAAAKSPWDISSNTLPSSDDDHFNFDHDQSSMLSSKLRHHQISGGGGPKSLLLQQQQMMLQARGFGGDLVDPSSFNPGGEALFNGFAGSLNGNQSQFHQQTQSQNFVAAAPAMNQAAAASGSAGGGASGQTRQRVRARRGQATDPHSIAERLRRERISERMKALQELVPNGNKTDKASMLDEIIDYVKFLQLQVKVLSMSRLGGGAPVNPLAPEGGVNRGGVSSNHGINNEGGTTVTENQVAKMLEDDMGSAMQYLQGKGLCLMPISLATAISTATTNSRNPMMSSLLAASGRGGDSGSGGGGGGDGGGPSSPNMSVLTVQSGNMGNGVGDGSA